MPWVGRLTTRCGLKGRETVGPAFWGPRFRSQSFELFLKWPMSWLSASVRARRALAALQAVRMGVPFFPGHRPSASEALGWGLPARWAGGEVFRQRRLCAARLQTDRDPVRVGATPCLSAC
jgi:hypothetical protein